MNTKARQLKDEQDQQTSVTLSRAFTLIQTYRTEMFLISFDIKYSLQLDKQDQGFIKALTYIYRRSKLNLELSFETQSYKPQNKKVIKLFRLHGESLIYFFTFKSNQQCKKSVKKEKSQSREQNMYAWQTSFFAIYFF